MTIELGPKPVQLEGNPSEERKVPRYQLIGDERKRPVTIVDIHRTIKPETSPHLIQIVNFK